MMKTASHWPALFAAVAIGLLSAGPAHAGTWRDHFFDSSLATEWAGDRNFFVVTNGVLEGQSAMPLSSPLHRIEVATDSTECVVGCWVNVVAPNTRVCTKGALILRHSGTNGYVFALHEPTQTIEVYRLPGGEMLLRKTASIELRRWYYLRAELQGPMMKFFVDGVLVGSVTDSVSTSGAVGVAVQDAEQVLFDDFSVTGPNVAGNVDDIARPAIEMQEASSDVVTLRFLVEAPYNYLVQVSSTPFSHTWQTITNFSAKLRGFEATVTDRPTEGIRFYRVEKVHCLCR
jgi:hypothetical protein